ncbi:LuxR C-terminal-related transcriptional regulator [Actinoplanes sp. NPDC051513]|uniref:LuxR C-terminal-related transcriptional regulator n=1 Tax=Actinoplanes sp. NPDC051513 TaxID=3363908 RepID=UPI0037B9F82E
MIEQATATEITPIAIEAYELSEREQQITRLVARGAGTREIAAELHLSRTPCATTSKPFSGRYASAVAASWSRHCSPSTTSRSAAAT